MLVQRGGERQALLVAAVGVRLNLKRLANATVALTGRVGSHDPAARC